MWFRKQPAEKRLIKNEPTQRKRTDFSVNAVGIAFFAALLSFALAVRMLVGRSPTLIDLSVLVATPIAVMGIMALFPRWTVAAKVLILVAIAAAALNFGEASLAFAFAFTGAILAPAVQKMEEWERAIILRFGAFHRVRGPGLFLVFPFADRIAKTVDLRIRVTDFSAETTLTKDSVTVTVDALCFWMVWDAEKAVLEVQDYQEAVVLSSKTALRDAISKHDLSAFLEHGDAIEERIREEVDKKTTEWGITVQHIEITDIQIPEALQDSLSRLAQAEREKQARVYLAAAEIEIAEKLEQAARIYDANGTAMKLKNLSILNEGLRAGNSMMLVPNSITEELRTKDLFGLEALAERRREAKEDEHGGS